jgi:hypothetical protein
MAKNSGFKPTGNGPRYGNFSFGKAAGFTNSAGGVQNVSGYTRKLPHHKDTRGRAQVKIGPGGNPKPVGDGPVGKKTIKHFADGGFVAKMQTSKMDADDSSVIKRTKPVTEFDSEHGGTSPLRPGFKKGGPIAKGKMGKPCYADGGKVATVGTAIKMIKALMARGESVESATAKAANRYGLSKTDVAPKAPPPGGDPQLLANGGMPMRAAPAIKQAATALAGRAPPVRIPTPVGGGGPGGPGGYGAFRRGPLVR